jgi:hypothetical protein
MPIYGDLGSLNTITGNLQNAIFEEQSQTAIENQSKYFQSGQGLNTLERQRESIDSAKLKLDSDGVISSVEPGTDTDNGIGPITTKLMVAVGSSWPNSLFANEGASGFLDSVLLQPIIEKKNLPSVENSDGQSKAAQGIGGPFGTAYKFKDWRGQLLQDEAGFPKRLLSGEQRFKLSRLPKTDKQLTQEPHSMRDVPLIFNDNRTDFFKFGLQSVYGLNPIENPADGSSTLRRDLFKGTPWEQSDPIFYGFDIVFDSLSSPLLNGSVVDFITNYSTVNEIFARRRVYEEFKYQFQKFFRTNAKMAIDPSLVNMAKSTVEPGDVGGGAQLPGHAQRIRAYFAHYLTSISGLENLVESNKGNTMDYLPKYREDFITLKLHENVSLSASTLIHLYKLLYWSKPNGKQLIPDNLLRFNCQIIVSECRNMMRVRKNVETGNIEDIKDNLSRWVYNLRECQFYFDKVPHPDEIDMAAEPKPYEEVTFAFDFKYVTSKLERFVPDGKGWGKYVTYDQGAIWKIGNKGSRSARNTGAGAESSVPPFYVDGLEPPDLNGVKVPYVVDIYGDETRVQGLFQSNNLDDLKAQSFQASKLISESTEVEEQYSSSSKFKLGNVISAVAAGQNVQQSKLGKSKLGKLFTPQVTALMQSSPFFDVQEALSFNQAPQLAAQGGLINSTLGKLYGGVPSPVDNNNPNNLYGDNQSLSAVGRQRAGQDLTQVPLQNAIFEELNINRRTIMKNKLNEDASLSGYPKTPNTAHTFAGEGPASFGGFGALSNGYRPVVPPRVTPSSLATANAQANITYIKGIGNIPGYQPPLVNSFSANRGFQQGGNYYVIEQLTNFAGYTLANQILNGPN